MSSPKVSKQQLQTLLVEFYQKHDADKLQYGVDIAGIVQWTLNNSFEDLQNLLVQSYGEGLDLSKKESKQSAMHHMSTALPKGGAGFGDSKRNELMLKIHDFYAEHSPDKLDAGLDKFVDFALYHGLPALNKKLIAKYGVGVPEGPYVPPRKKGGPSPPPPEPRAPAEPVFDVDVHDLRQRLEAFYQQHDPEKAGDLDPIVDWGASIGLDALDLKLMQIYGEGLYDFEVANIAPPPYEEPGPPPPVEPRSPPAAPSRPVAPPRAAPTPSAPKPVSPTGGGVKHWATPGVSTTKAPVAASGVVGGTSGDGPCGQYRLDMTGTTFGVCVCGFSRMEHQRTNGRTGGGPARSAPLFPRTYTAGATAAKPPKPAAAKPAAPAPKPAAPAPKPAAPAPSARPTAGSDQGPCLTYHLDMSGLRYGDCTCGYSRADHQPGQRAKIIELLQHNKKNAPKAVAHETAPEPAPQSTQAVAQTAGGSSGACSQYRLDMVNGAYGDCVCGHSRAEHTGGKSQAGGAAPRKPSAVTRKASGFVKGVKRLSQKVMGQANSDLKQQLADLKRQEEEVKRKMELANKLEALKAEEERVRRLLEDGSYDPNVHDQGYGERDVDGYDAVQSLETSNPHYDQDCFDQV